jgi:outer membrane protein TolC
VNFDVTVETAGKRGLRMEHGRLVAEAARLNIAATAWQARSNARTALLNFTATQRRALLLRDQTAAQEKILALLEQRLQAGALTSSELSFSRINLHRIRLDTLDAERLHVEAEGQLAEAIGVPVKAVEGIKLSADPLASTKMPEELTTSDVRRQALLTRADILSALADYAASQAALRLEIAKQYPDFHINPGYQWDQGESKWQLGLTVELPLLNRNQGPIAEAEARRAEAAARFNAVQAKVMAEVDRTVAVFRITEKNADLLQSLAAAQTRQREAVQAQVQAGAADQLDLLNAQFDYGNAELGRLDGQMRLAQAVGALEDAVQRPLGIPQGIIEMEPSHAP